MSFLVSRNIFSKVGNSLKLGVAATSRFCQRNTIDLNRNIAVATEAMAQAVGEDAGHRPSLARPGLVFGRGSPLGWARFWSLLGLAGGAGSLAGRSSDGLPSVTGSPLGWGRVRVGLPPGMGSALGWRSLLGCARVVGPFWVVGSWELGSWSESIWAFYGVCSSRLGTGGEYCTCDRGGKWGATPATWTSQAQAGKKRTRGTSCQDCQPIFCPNTAHRFVGLAPLGGFALGV